MDKPLLSRRRVIFLGSATAAAALMPGCDNLVLDQPGLIDGIDPITPNEEFYQYQHGQEPFVIRDTWNLTFGDRGSDLLEIDADWLDQLVETTFEHTLQCIGSGPRNRLISNAVWGGATLKSVLEQLGITVDPSIVEIRLVGADDYHTSVPVEDLDDGPLWLVWRMNGELLPAAHGLPARLIVPGRYGTKNVKWLTRIELLDTPYTGFWEEIGWSKAATCLCNGFIMSPGHLTEYPLGPIRFVGTAFAGKSMITRVEVTTDDGATWKDATIDYSPGPNVWTLWSFDFDPPELGFYTVRLRVTSDDGMVADHPQATAVFDGYDGGMEVELEVRLIALLLALLAPAEAGGWTREQGSFYTKVGIDVYLADNYTAADRDVEEAGAYYGRQLVLYGEVGVAERWPVQVLMQLPLVFGTLYADNLKVPPSGPRASSTRLGDLRFAAQTALTRKLPLAAAFEVKLPLYQNGTVGDEYGLAYQELFPLPGDGQVDFTGWLLLGSAIPDTPLWNDLGVGYRHRTEWFIGWDTDVELVDGIAFYDTFGATFGRVVPMIRVEGIVNFVESEFTRQYVNLGPVVLVGVSDELAIEARLGFDLWTRNATRGVGFGLGLSWRR